MHPALWISKTGLDANQTEVSIITHNLANVETTGFKKSRGVFADLLYQSVRAVGGPTSANTNLPSGLVLGTGVKTIANQKDFSQGNLENTKKTLDLAIQGNGFFQILLPDGTLAYTRTGNFSLNESGQIVTQEGYLLQPTLTIPNEALEVSIGKDGTISVQTQGSSALNVLGTLQLADFINPSGLQPLGDNLYQPSDSSGLVQTSGPSLNGYGSVLQGFLEASNVNVVEELVGLIQAQRAYEMDARAIQSVDDMLRFVVQTI